MALTRKECYQRIYDWHKKNGASEIKNRYKKDNEYSRAYLGLLEKLPDPSSATEGDMDFIFGEVLYMLMEWSYQAEDEHGNKISDYAHTGIKEKYEKGMHDSEFKKSKESSVLYDEFGSPDKWRQTYK